jgi:glycosyltransferase involved in cell wall biosynthesis
MRHADPRLSIVIPAWKAEATIARTLASVRNCATIPLHVVVVVDGEFDGTAEIARGFRAEVIVNPEQRGAQASRNIGLASVTTDCVAFLDADDYVEGDLHGGMVRSLSYGADLSLSTYVREQPDGSRQTCTSRRFERQTADSPHALATWVGTNDVVTGALCFRTEALRRIGGWDESLSTIHDFELGIRAFRARLVYTTNSDGQLVYVNADDDRRLTRQPLGRMLPDHLRILSTVEADATADDVAGRALRRALAMRYYRLSSTYYRERLPAAGEMLLAHARRLGFAGHAGSVGHRLAAGLVGLGNKQKISLWYSALKRLGAALLHPTVADRAQELAVGATGPRDPDLGVARSRQPSMRLALSLDGPDEQGAVR